MLGLATFGGPHLLILDEPTNHLDIDSRAALIEAINDYPGAIILVSHDRYLLDACADRLWLVADGKVTPFDGDLDDYRRRVLSDRSDDAAASRAERGRQAAAQCRPTQERGRSARADAKPLRQRVDARRGRDRRGSPARSRSSTQRSADGGLFARDPAKAAALAKTRAESAARAREGRRGLARGRRGA